MTEKMHYFRPVAGRAACRFGTTTFIGATRSPNGFVINTDVVVAISDTEVAPHRKSYANYIKHGDLKKATAADYTAYLDSRKAASDAVAEKRKADAKAAKSAKTKAAKAVASTPNDSASTDVDSGSAA